MRRTVVLLAALALAACGSSGSSTSASSSSSTGSSSSASSTTTSTSTSTTSPTTTSSPPTNIDIHAVDFTNRTYSGQLCAPYFAAPSDVPASIEVHDGESDVLSPDLMVRLHVQKPNAFGDLTGDGTDEAVVVPDCSGGASGSFGTILLFAAGEDDAVQIGSVAQPPEVAASGYYGFTHIEVTGGKLLVTWTDWQPADPHCCPTKQQTFTYAYDGSTFAVTDKGPVVDLTG